MNRILMLCLMLCVTSAPVLLTSGCATTTSEAKAFLTFQSTWTAAHTAYAAFCDQVVKGKVSADKEALADQAWNAFRSTFREALKASHLQAQAPAEVQALAKKVVILTN